MKRVGFISAIVMIIFVVFIVVNKSYYPSLPINNLSAKEVIEELENSNNKVVEIAVEDDAIWFITRTDNWFITRTDNQGILIADENIKQMIGLNGWEFKEKEGSGLFFEKDGERLIATTQMWSKKYVLVKVQRKFIKL